VVDWGYLILAKEKFGSLHYYRAWVDLEVSSFGKAKEPLLWGGEMRGIIAEFAPRAR
jgi:hypothetical protein